MKLSNCTGRLDHWLLGQVTIEDWGTHWRFTAFRFGFMLTWYRPQKAGGWSTLRPRFEARYVGTPMWLR
jgi:hypothetical protein